MNDVRRREHRDRHENDGACALQPRRPAEKQPPHDDSQPAAQDSAEHSVQHRLGSDDGENHPGQPLKHHGDYARPYPEGFLVSGFVCVSTSHTRSYPSNECVFHDEGYPPGRMRVLRRGGTQGPRAECRLIIYFAVNRGENPIAVCMSSNACIISAMSLATLRKHHSANASPEGQPSGSGVLPNKASAACGKSDLT